MEKKTQNFKIRRALLLLWVIFWRLSWLFHPKLVFLLMDLLHSSRVLHVGTKYWGFPSGSVVKNRPAIQEAWVLSLGQEDPLEECMATHSSILAWRMPWTQEPGRLEPIGWQRAGHDWSDWLEQQMLTETYCGLAPYSVPCRLQTVTQPEDGSFPEQKIHLWMRQKTLPSESEILSDFFLLFL